MIQVDRVTDIVATHSFAATVGSRLRDEYACRLFVVATDFVLHSRHAESLADAYFTAPQCQFRGAWNNADVRTSGIPIGLEFANPYDPGKARALLGLADRPTVLFSFGGSGLGAERHLTAIRRTADSHRDLQIIVLTGRNTRFLQQATAALEAARTLIVPFKENVAVYYAAADAYIGRAGGLSLSEAMACKLPIGIIGALPGQETINASVLKEAGLASILPSFSALDSWLRGRIPLNGRVASKNMQPIGSAAIVAAIVSSDAELIRTHDRVAVMGDWRRADVPVALPARTLPAIH